MTDQHNPDTPTEDDFVNEFARSSLEDWHEEEWAEKDKAAARRGIAKIKADALREAAGQIRHKQHPESVRQMLRRSADRIEEEA